MAWNTLSDKIFDGQNFSADKIFGTKPTEILAVLSDEIFIGFPVQFYKKNMF